MAYESKVTNKYFGTTFAGAGRATVQTDGLMEALKTVSPKLQEMGSSYIEKQQKEAEVELASLQASGKSLEDIQKIITSGENEKLNSMYATATNDMWIGKTQAAEDWKSVLANQDNYDPKSQSAEEFLNEHVTADFNKGGKYFSGAYASVWNEKKAAFLTQDAQSRFEVRNKEEIDSMADFIKIYQGTENGVTIAQRLETKLNSDGKPPTPKQINAAILQGTEQLIELGDYDRAESFLKSHRGYNGKMEVKSLLDSGNAKAHDLMKQIRVARNTKVIADAKARKDKIKRRGDVLMSQYATGEKEGGVKLTLEEQEAVTRELMTADHIARFSLFEKIVSKSGSVMNSPLVMENLKSEMLSNNFIGSDTGFDTYLQFLANRGQTLTPSQASDLSRYFSKAQAAFREGYSVESQPQVINTINRLNQEFVTSSKEYDRKKQDVLFKYIEDHVNMEIKKWMAEDMENIPMPKGASLEAKNAYDTHIKNKLNDIYNDIAVTFDPKSQLKVYAETRGTILDFNKEETRVNMLRASSQIFKNLIEPEATQGTIGEYETINKLVEESERSGVPIPKLIKQSSQFEEAIRLAKGKMNREDLDLLAIQIMDDYNITDNTQALQERAKYTTDKFNQLKNTDMDEGDLGVVQTVIDAFTDSDEIRQAQRVQETLSDLLGYEVSGEYLLSGIEESELEEVADKFGIPFEEFKNVLRRIR